MGALAWGSLLPPRLLPYREAGASRVKGPAVSLAGGGLAMSAGGLFATLAAAATSLSATGTIATIAASAAGLFSFKLSKELSERGVDRSAVQQGAFFGCARRPHTRIPLTAT